MSIQLFVGADIAAATICIHWQNLQSAQVGDSTIAQTPKAYRALIQQLTRMAAAESIHVVMEATGSYWIAFAHALHDASIRVSVLNPSQARHFARARLQRAKTDRVDAQLLSEYGRIMQPDAWVPPPAVCQHIQLLLNRRDDLLKMRTAERNRLHALKHYPTPDTDVRRHLLRHIESLTREANRIARQVQALLLSDPNWAAAVAHLRTLKGMGYLTIARILTATHAFARCDTPEQAAAFAGLAPVAQDSGQRKGKRALQGGHAALRQALYMSALSAVRSNPLLKDFYDRLRQAGKPVKVAFCAVARKLLHIAWALVVKQRDFDPAFRSSRPIPT